MTPVHHLSDVDVRAVSIVSKGANRKRFFLFKTAVAEGPSFATRPGAVLAKSDWSAVYCVVAEPGALEDPGLYGDQSIPDRWASEEEIRKAAHRFMKNGGLVNLLHDGIKPYGKLVESAVALNDFTVNGETIRKGSWYIAFEPNMYARGRIESGEFGGISIEGTGSRTLVEKAFDPRQPRDRYGRWIDIPGGENLFGLDTEPGPLPGNVSGQEVLAAIDARLDDAEKGLPENLRTSGGPLDRLKEWVRRIRRMLSDASLRSWVKLTAPDIAAANQQLAHLQREDPDAIWSHPSHLDHLLHEVEHLVEEHAPELLSNSDILSNILFKRGTFDESKHKRDRGRFAPKAGREIAEAKPGRAKDSGKEVTNRITTAANILRALGYTGNLAAALREFQAKVGLPATGAADEQTMRALRSKMGRARRRRSPKQTMSAADDDGKGRDAARAGRRKARSSIGPRRERYAKASLARTPEKDNWIDNLPAAMRAAWKRSWIHRAAEHMTKKGMPVGRAIATAVNAAKKGCATGDLNFSGAQAVNAASKAEMCAAVALWTSMKVASKGQRVSKRRLAKWKHGEETEESVVETFENLVKLHSIAKLRWRSSQHPRDWRGRFISVLDRAWIGNYAKRSEAFSAAEEQFVDPNGFLINGHANLATGEIFDFANLKDGQPRKIGEIVEDLSGRFNMYLDRSYKKADLEAPPSSPRKSRPDKLSAAPFPTNVGSAALDFPGAGEVGRDVRAALPRSRRERFDAAQQRFEAGRAERFRARNDIARDVKSQDEILPLVNGKKAIGPDGKVVDLSVGGGADPPFPILATVNGKSVEVGVIEWNPPVAGASDYGFEARLTKPGWKLKEEGAAPTAIGRADREFDLIDAVNDAKVVGPGGKEEGIYLGTDSRLLVPGAKQVGEIVQTDDGGFEARLTNPDYKLVPKAPELGSSGHPLGEPTSPEEQSQAEKLSSNSVDEPDYLGGGVSPTYTAALEDNGDVVIKGRIESEGFRDNLDETRGPEHAVAAARIARYFDVPTPEAQVRDLDDSFGDDAIEWLEEEIPDSDYGVPDPTDVGVAEKIPDFYSGEAGTDMDAALAERFMVLDYVIGNTDRHNGNWGTDGSTTYAIDMDLVFPQGYSSGWGNYTVFEDDDGSLVGRPLAEDTKGLLDDMLANRDAWESALRSDGLDDDEIDGVFERAQALVRAGTLLPQTDILPEDEDPNRHEVYIG